MLKQRVLTALPLGVVVVAAILSLPPGWIAGLFALIVGLGALEWARLSGILGRPGQLVFAAAICVPSVLLWRYADTSPAWLAGVGASWWLAIQVWMLATGPRPSTGRPDWGWLLAGWLTLTLSITSLMLIRTQWSDGARLLLLTLAIVWAADIGAYFSGKRWGRHKLAPQTSPGKSWEGAVGGLLVVALLALLASRFIETDALSVAWLVGAAVVAGVFSITGDLYESRLKRAAGAKDSGTLLPGHGGVLDRIDSINAAAPVFLAGLLWAG